MKEKNKILRMDDRTRQYIRKARRRTTQKNWRDSVGYEKLVRFFARDIYKEFQREKNAALMLYGRISVQLARWSKKEYSDIWEKRQISPREEEIIIEKISDKDRRLVERWIKGWDKNVKPEKITRILKAWAVKAGTLGGSHALKRLDLKVTFNLRDKKLLKALARRGTKITGGISKKTLKDFQNILYRSYVEQGISPYEVRRRIKGLFEDTYRHRAMAIARTETGVASSTVQHITYKKNGIKKKRWFTIIDERTRESHDFTDGQEQLIDDPFDVQGVLMMHPHDSSAPADEIINCRCDEDAIVIETIASADAWIGG